MAAEKLDDHKRDLPPHEGVHPHRFNDRGPEGEFAIDQFAGSHDADLPYRSAASGIHLGWANADMQSPISTQDFQIERLRLGFFHDRREFRAVGEWRSVNLQNFIASFQSAAVGRSSRTDGANQE